MTKCVATAVMINSGSSGRSRGTVWSMTAFSGLRSNLRGGRRRPAPSIIQEASQYPRAAWVLQLSQRLGFDLADALARHRELLADLFQRVIGVHADAEAHAQHALLARRERGEHPGRGFAQVRLDGGIDRQDRILV